MRWSQGVWSEERLKNAVNETNSYYALPYGLSSVAPTNDVRAFELYFERLDKAGLSGVKRPDLLIFRKDDKSKVDKIVSELGGLTELPFIDEVDQKDLITTALVGIECENSLWKAQKMPDFGAIMTPQKRLNGKLGLKKTAIVPTIIVKEEDRTPLLKWQQEHGKPIHIWHVFFDRAYGIAFDEAQKLIK